MRSARQTGRTIEVWAVLRHFRSEQEAGLACRLGRRFKAFRALRSPPETRAPLRRLRVYPCPLCSGNNLLTQTISTAKSENPISLTRPSTENVGGLFLSIYLIKSTEVNHAKTENPC